MENKIIVFDFDKTLTYHDTLFGFFMICCQKNILLPLKVSIYSLLMILTKINLISNSKLKLLGVCLFLRDKSAVHIDKISSKYIERIKFNKLFKQYDFTQEQKVYIVSASFDVYLRKIFPDNVVIIGSQIEYSSGVVSGLKYNCYKDEKIKALSKIGVNKIDEFYTDSHSDFSLAKISNKIIIVKRDKLFECNDFNAFNKYFNKDII